MLAATRMSANAIAAPQQDWRLPALLGAPLTAKGCSDAAIARRTDQQPSRSVALNTAWHGSPDHTFAVDAV